MTRGGMVEGVPIKVTPARRRPLHHQPAAGGPPPRAGEDW